MGYTSPMVVSCDPQTHIRLVESETIATLVRKTKYYIESIWSGKCKHLVIGHRQAFNLEEEACRRQQMLSFGVELCLMNCDKLRVCGLRVHVVPWFDGVLLLPDWEEKDKAQK